MTLQKKQDCPQREPLRSWVRHSTLKLSYLLHYLTVSTCWLNALECSFCLIHLKVIADNTFYHPTELCTYLVVASVQHFHNLCLKQPVCGHVEDFPWSNQKGFLSWRRSSNGNCSAMAVCDRGITWCSSQEDLTSESVKLIESRNDKNRSNIT